MVYASNMRVRKLRIFYYHGLSSEERKQFKEICAETNEGKSWRWINFRQVFVTKAVVQLIIHGFLEVKFVDLGDVRIRLTSIARAMVKKHGL